MERIEVMTVSAKDGNPVLKALAREKEFFLSSRYFPVAEAEKLADNLTFKNPTVIIIGLGNPYLVYSISRKNPDKRIVVVEPSKDIFEAVRSRRELIRLVTTSNVEIKLIEEDSELKDLLSSMDYFDFYIHPQYKTILSSVREFELIIRNAVIKAEVNRNTLRKFGNVWVKNFILSVGEVLSSKGVKSAFGAFRGIDVVIVGAGPSLDKDAPTLKRLYSSSVLVSVDTSASYLSSIGLKPDIVITVDPQLKNFIYNILNKDYTNTIFVCDTLYPPIIYKFVPKRNIFTFDSPLKVWNFIREEFGIEKGEVLVGGSVICSAVDLAHKIGARRILLMGADLSFPNGRIYAKGNFYEVSNFLSSTVFSPYSEWKILSNYPLVERISKNGNRVFTDARMLTFKEWLENYIKEREVEVADLSSEGLEIAGTRAANVCNFDGPEVRGRIESVKHHLIAESLEEEHNHEVYLILRKKIAKIIELFEKKGVYGVIDLLEEDEFAKFLVELGIQDLLLREYSEEEFLERLKKEIKYITRITRFIEAY